MSQSRLTLIDAWAESQGLARETRAATHRLAVTFDRVRVVLHQVPTRGVLAEARVTELPLADRERDLLIERAMQTATGRMRQTSIRLAMRPEVSALCLQVEVPGDSDPQALSDAIERLVNEVELWRAVL